MYVLLTHCLPAAHSLCAGFQFINCYFSLFYVAFFKRYGVRYSDTIYDKCEPDECMEELGGLVLSILLFNLVGGAAIEFFTPIISKELAQLIAAIKGACTRKRVGTEDSLPLPLPPPPPLPLPRWAPRTA